MFKNLVLGMVLLATAAQAQTPVEKKPDTLSFDSAYRAILDLVPTNPRQQSLRNHMLDRIYLVSESRTKRENLASC